MSGSLTAEEMFQDYMSGGVRRGVRRVAPKRVAPKRVAPKRVAPKRVAPKRKPRTMASLYGGFFESLEGFAEVAKDNKKKETYADDKNPMTPLAKAEVKGGAKKVKKVVKKAKKPVKKPVGMGMGRYHRGGYEEEQYQEQEEQSEHSEEFMNVQDAVKQVKELIGGYHRAVRRAAAAKPRRAASPARRRVAVSLRRAASPARRRA